MSHVPVLRRIQALLVTALILAAANTLAADPEIHVDHPDPAATREAKRAMSRFKIPDGLKIDLFAADPLLANPVAFCFDERGRLFVAEAYRIGSGRGVEDNRGHMYWLDDDLAAKTVEDRVAYMKKHHPDRVDDYTRTATESS